MLIYYREGVNAKVFLVSGIYRYFCTVGGPAHIQTIIKLFPHVLANKSGVTVTDHAIFSDDESVIRQNCRILGSESSLVNNEHDFCSSMIHYTRHAFKNVRRA